VGRTSDKALRAELLESAVDYVCKHGLADLSLRPLAAALGSSPSLLLYHFGSKEALLVAIIRAGRARQHAVMRNVELAGKSERDAARLLWRSWSGPAWRPITRLFFEVYALALQTPSRFPGFLDEAVADWVTALADGDESSHARARATVMLAAFRGLLLDLCSTNDKARVDAAAEIFFAMLDGRAETKQSHAAS
jgi:AcrR family transcriptional regulator